MVPKGIPSFLLAILLVTNLLLIRGVEMKNLTISPTSGIPSPPPRNVIHLNPPEPNPLHHRHHFSLTSTTTTPTSITFLHFSSTTSESTTSFSTAGGELERCKKSLIEQNAIEEECLEGTKTDEKYMTECKENLQTCREWVKECPIENQHDTDILNLKARSSEEELETCHHNLVAMMLKNSFCEVKKEQYRKEFYECHDKLIRCIDNYYDCFNGKKKCRWV